MWGENVALEHNAVAENNAVFQLFGSEGNEENGKSAIRKAIQCVVHKAPFYIRNSEDVKDGFIRLEFDDYIINGAIDLIYKDGDSIKVLDYKNSEYNQSNMEKYKYGRK